MKKEQKEELDIWIEQFIAEVNITQITDDGGDSFNSSIGYLKMKLKNKINNIVAKQRNEDAVNSAKSTARAIKEATK
uniref:Uncharacterized protein n=1 Tax=viral metagenome TaxID=1070528 RepID=A0A6H1ZFM4_9ZZZZ